MSNETNSPRSSDNAGRKLQMALIGGGGAGFIGRVHATAATLDNRAELVAGALSSDPHRARQAAVDFGIDSTRGYGSYLELIETELQRPRRDRIDFVSIATPNHTHFEIAKAALTAGLNVVCDKPMTTRLAQAEELAALVRETGAIFAVTHNYSGYPLVRQARDMIASGELGQVCAWRANYIQGWLRGMPAGETPKRGAWKSDPEKAGSGALGDIASHAYHLARFITRLSPSQLCCQLSTFQQDRALDDYGHIMLRFADEAVGAITFSQVTHGRLNDLAIEIDGTTGSLAWRQEQPNQLVLRRFDRPVEIYERNPMASYTSDAARAACRLPGGHPEAFFEAFANVYRDAFADMVARASGQPVNASSAIYPTVEDGVEGVRFIETCLASHQENANWVAF